MNTEYNTDKLENKEQPDKPVLTKLSLLGYVFYLGIAILSIILGQQHFGANIVLGDSGTITRAVLFVLAITSLKWTPVLSLVGIVLYYKRQKIKDTSFLYMILTSIVFVVSVVILILKI